jgi:hypothetical protein
MRSHFYISFGLWIALIPFLGIPYVWKNYLILASGIFISLLSLTPILLNKLRTKPKIVRKKREILEKSPYQNDLVNSSKEKETSKPNLKVEPKLNQEQTDLVSPSLK